MATLVRVVFLPSMVAFAAGLAAQANLNQSRGVLAGAPLALQVEGGIAGDADARVRLHRNGLPGEPLVTFGLLNNPPNLSQILVAHGAPLSIDIDDFSTGRDEVLVSGDGYLDVPASSWGVLSFSLRQGAAGVITSTQPRIAQEALLGSIGAAVFSWVLPGSNLPSQVVGRVERSHSRQDLVLPVGSEVDAIDVPLMLGRDQSALTTIETGFAPLVQTSTTTFEAIYFTVASASLASVPNAWWGANPATKISGATVLVTERSAPNAPWSQPHVYCTWQELALSQNEDIDGLAVDTSEQKVMFSLVGTTRDQFLFIDLGADGIPPAPHVVKTAQGNPISGQIGKAQGDDVDAVCTLDPVIGSTGGLPPAGDDFGSSCGAPRNGLLGVPSVHASAFRRRAAGATFFDTWLVGWPPVTGMTAGLAVPFVTIGDDLTLFPLGPILLRNIADVNPGNPCSASLPMPNGYSLSGQRITIRWVAVDAGFTELAEAWPVQVFL